MTRGHFLVKEAMNTRPITVKVNASVIEAARLMRDEGIGSCIVVDKKPIGIITESDIIKKLVAEDLKAGETSIAEIMTSPFIVIGPYVDIEEAMKTMSKCNVRRLPVIEKGELVGIITQKDILRISPVLLEISREWCDIEGVDESHFKKQTFSGKCEDCGTLSTNLRAVDGRLLCDDCIDALKYE